MKKIIFILIGILISINLFSQTSKFEEIKINKISAKNNGVINILDTIKLKSLDKLWKIELVGDTLFVNNDTLVTPPIIKKKVYKALISQSGTNAPTAIVLENTIGNIVFSYVSTGTYLATLQDMLLHKTLVPYNAIIDPDVSGGNYVTITVKKNNDNSVIIYSMLISDLIDDTLNNTLILIEVYE